MTIAAAMELGFWIGVNAGLVLAILIWEKRVMS